MNLEKGPQSETPIEEEKEKEPKPKVVFVYRGENPYLMGLVEKFKQEGYGIDERRLAIDVELPKEEGDESEIEIKEKEKKTREIIGDIPEDIIITDRTVNANVRLISKREQIIDAYDHEQGGMKSKFEKVSDVIEYLKPIIDEIKGKGKQPVLLQTHIGDHIFFDDEKFQRQEEEVRNHKEAVENYGGCGYPRNEQEKDRRMRAAILSVIAKEEFKVPLITAKKFRWEDGVISGDAMAEENIINSILEQEGLNKEDVVLLVDHHVYELNGTRLQKTGLLEVPVVCVCPCCIGQPTYESELKKLGFNFFDLEYTRETDNAFRRLKERVQKIASELSKSKEKEK